MTSGLALAAFLFGFTNHKLKSDALAVGLPMHLNLESCQAKKETKQKLLCSLPVALVWKGLTLHCHRQSPNVSIASTSCAETSRNLQPYQMRSPEEPGPHIFATSGNPRVLSQQEPIVGSSDFRAPDLETSCNPGDTTAVSTSNCLG